MTTTRTQQHGTPEPGGLAEEMRGYSKAGVAIVAVYLLLLAAAVAFALT